MRRLSSICDERSASAASRSRRECEFILQEALVTGRRGFVCGGPVFASRMSEEGGSMDSTPLRYEVEARVVALGVSEARCKQTAVRFDSSAGQSESLPGPAELLAMAFAACALKNVERFSKLLPFRYEDAWIRVVAERQDAPPRFTSIEYELHISTDEPPERVDLLERNMAKYGTVYNTLASACEVSGKVIAAEPSRARTRAGG
jgi:uncharacterized OsmC-like protein